MDSDLVEKNLTAQYLLIGQDIKDLQAKQKLLKDRLEPTLLASETNSRGSYVFPFQEPLRVGSAAYKSIQKVRKVTTTLDQDAVMAWAYQNLTEYDQERLIVTTQSVNQDVLWDLYVNDELDEDTYNSFITEEISWSFLPVKV